MTRTQGYPETPTQSDGSVEGLFHAQTGQAFGRPRHEGPQQGAGLGNTTNSVSTPASSLVTTFTGLEAEPNRLAAAKRRDGRDDRYVVRETMQRFSTIKRAKLCGRASVRRRGTVDVWHDRAAGAAWFSGLGVCGSVWACPVCSAKIQAGRRAQLRRVMEWAAEKDYTVAFITKTLRHDASQKLGLLWATLTEANRRVATTRAVRKRREELGFVGYVRALEVTHGENGWHPHTHELAIFKAELTDVELDELGDLEFSRYLRTCVRMGLAAPTREHGYRIQRVTCADEVADYMAKDQAGTAILEETASSAAFEMQGEFTKSGRAGNRNPFQIALDFVSTYNADDLDLWHEYEKASHDRRALTWSRGLKALAGVDDVTDEELAEGDEGEKAESPVFTIRDYWRDLGKDRPALGAQLLTVLEVAGERAARQWCWDMGIELIEADHLDAVADRIEMDRRVSEQKAAAAEDVAEIERMRAEWLAKVVEHSAAEELRKRPPGGVVAMPSLCDPVVPGDPFALGAPVGSRLCACDHHEG